MGGRNKKAQKKLVWETRAGNLRKQGTKLFYYYPETRDCGKIYQSNYLGSLIDKLWKKGGEEELIFEYHLGLLDLHSHL